MNKYIVGLGCSWTQGEGGYPEHIWKEYNGRVQVRYYPDDHLRIYEHENSWVNVLSRDHFSEYIPMNLGVKGIGNRAAVHQLHFCDKIDWANSEGIIVLMLSGFDRFDFFQECPRRPSRIDDGYSNGEYDHYKWRTMWPIPGAGRDNEPLFNIYNKMLWSEQFVASEGMMALLDLQTFAKSYGFKVIVANAFNIQSTVPEYLRTHTGNLVDKFDWSSSYIHNDTTYSAFVQKLVELDGRIPVEDWRGFHQFYNKLDWPSEYLTNCEGAHPTIKGYKVIGDELATFIKNHDYI